MLLMGKLTISTASWSIRDQVLFRDSSIGWATMHCKAPDHSSSFRWNGPSDLRVLTCWLCWLAILRGTQMPSTDTTDLAKMSAYTHVLYTPFVAKTKIKVQISCRTQHQSDYVHIVASIFRWVSQGFPMHESQKALNCPTYLLDEIYIPHAFQESNL